VRKYIQYLNPTLGIISNVAVGEDRNNITLVKDLVMSHIKGNCLILLTLNMRGMSFNL